MFFWTESETPKRSTDAWFWKGLQLNLLKLNYLILLTLNLQLFMFLWVGGFKRYDNIMLTSEMANSRSSGEHLRSFMNTQTRLNVWIIICLTTIVPSTKTFKISAWIETFIHKILLQILNYQISKHLTYE